MPELVKAKAIDIDSFNQTDGATGDGSTTAFVLTDTPKAGSLKVFVNGLRDMDYTLTVATKTINFNSAPEEYTNLLFEYWKV